MSEPPAPPLVLSAPLFSSPRVLSPGEVSQDSHSRTTFSGLATKAAIALAEQTFHIGTPSWTPPGSEPGTRITNYLSAYSATEERSDGAQVLVDSTVPLDAEEGSQKVPLSATLRDQGTDYAPEHPFAPFTIAKSAAGGVSFESGPSVAPTQAESSEAPTLVGNQLVYPNTAPDTDFMVEPLPGGTGAELSWQLRSGQSPEEDSLSFTLPLGAQLQLSSADPGAAEVIQGDQTLLWIPPPSARDASGAPVKAQYSVSADQLITHVELKGNIDFPVLVDPLIYVGYGGGGGWTGWNGWQSCGCFNLRNVPGELRIGTKDDEEIAGGVSSQQYGEWYINPDNGSVVKVTRVDMQNVHHEPWVSNASSAFQGFMYQGGAPLASATYTQNGATRTPPPNHEPLSTWEYFGGHDYAFCAADGGGYDGNGALCNENVGGEGFAFALVAEPIGFNREWRQEEEGSIGAAEVKYLQTQPPTLSTAGSSVPAGWISSPEHDPYLQVEGKDAGVGVTAVGLDAVQGEYGIGNPALGAPGSHPAPGFSSYSPACSPPFCWAGLFDPGQVSEGALATGVWTLRPWTTDAVGLAAESTYLAHIDHTPPVIAKPSWEGATFGEGPNTISFSAKDGSAQAPQSGVKFIDVYVDSKENDVYKPKTTCPEPKEASVIPTEACEGLSGSYTLDGEDYAAGPHTITLVATDWAGNQSEETYKFTIAHAANETQQVGPGTLNLLTGDYKLGASDVSVQAGNAALSVSRTYDSQSTSTGPLGPGWMLSTPDTAAAGQWQSLTPVSGGVEALTTGGRHVRFTQSGEGFTSEQGFTTYTLTETSTSLVEYRITDAAGDYTQFAEPSGATAFMPTAVGQAAGAGGINQVTYVLKEGRTSEIVGPPPAPGVKCTETFVKGCRALVLHYATSKTAKGEAPSEWGEVPGQLASVSFVEGAPSKSEYTTIPVAEYAYDANGYLRAEWDPRISPALKTTYGYGEGRLAAMTSPGQQPWTFTYGTTTGDPVTERLLDARQAQPQAGASEKEVAERLTEQKQRETNSEVPQLGGNPVIGATLSASSGVWTNHPVAYAYQWERCASAGSCAAIGGAVNPTYTVQSSDNGDAIRVHVVATNGGGSLGAQSAESSKTGSATESAAAPFGRFGSGQGAFLDPDGIAVDHSGKVWVADPINHRVEELNEAGKYVGQIGTNQGGNGNCSYGEYELCYAWAVTTDAAGHVWVTNVLWNQVEEFTASGSSSSVQARLMKRIQINAGRERESEFPDGIAVNNTTGDVWVVGAGSDRISELSQAGKLEGAFGSKGSGAGQLKEPRGLALDSSGDVWLADTANNRIQELSPAGAFMMALGWGVKDGKAELESCTKAPCQAGIAGSEPGQFKEPVAVSVDSEGHVYVTDGGEPGQAGDARIQEFAKTGAYLGQLGSKGIGSGEVSDPWATAIDTHGRLRVLDRSLNDVVVPARDTEPQHGSTIHYEVPVSGSGAPYEMGGSEVAKWAQKDAPTSATAIFPPDEPQSWPASDYRRASVYYFDSAERQVNVASPGGRIGTTQYEPFGNAEWTLTPGNRQRALEAGAGSAASAELLDTKSTYIDEGMELQSSTGPQHEVKLANGTQTQARTHTRYVYDEGEAQQKSQGGTARPFGEVQASVYVKEGSALKNEVTVPDHLVTESKEGALLPNGSEEDVRTIKTSYSGQNNLGKTLRKPTSVTVEPQAGHPSTRTTVYNAETGDVVENIAPAGSATNPQPIFRGSFGSAGSLEGQFADPSDDAIDAHGNLWVTDAYNSRVQVLSPTGTVLKVLGCCGTGEGDLSGPQGIAINKSSGKVYVADQSNNRVEIYNEKYEHVGQFGESGTAAGKFNGAEGVAIDQSGNVWVTDWGNNRVEEFSAEGKFERAFGECSSGKEALSQPQGIAIYNGTVYVENFAQNRIDEYTETGGCAGEFGEAGSGNGQLSNATWMTFSSTGTLYVADAGNNRIEEFSSAGAYLTAFGVKGAGTSEFSEPEGVALASSGELYVTDSSNERIEEWTPPVQAVHDSKIIYYSQAANAAYPGCGGHPEWAYLPCETVPGAQPQSPGLPGLPEATTTYNVWDEPLTSTEKVGSQTRTTTNTYDAAGRVKTTAVTSTTGKAVAPVSNEYSSETGALIKQTSEESGKPTLKSAFNTLGQLTSYTDASGNTSTYTYDEYGRPKSVFDGKGTQTYSYDPTTDAVTGLTDSAAGSFAASYNTEGQLEAETYPNGMKAAYAYNAVGQTTAVTYTKGSSTWYSDQVAMSIAGQWLTQTSTLGHDSYSYDNLGRMTEAQETPTGKNCTAALYAYDEDSNRTSETIRNSTTGTCLTTGGTTTVHSYDEANRLIDSGTTYEPFGGATAVPAADAGGHALESTYYASGALYTESQNAQTNSYALDPAGRRLVTTSQPSAGKATTTVAHYAGTGSTPAWTEEEGTTNFTRNVIGIGGSNVAIQSAKEILLQIVNLHGDVVGTVPDTETATPKLLTSEPTAFGVPTTPNPEPDSWLGAGGLKTEFASGVASGGAGGAYVPQLGLHLAPEALTGAAAQDPVNEYLDNEGDAEPTGTRSFSLPGAIEPLPVNAQAAKEFYEQHPYDPSPVNEPELVDPEGLTSYKATLARAAKLRSDAAWAQAGGLLVDVFLDGLGIGVEAYVAGLLESADNLEECVIAGKEIGGKPGRWGTCDIHEYTFLGIPVIAEAELCLYKETRSWGKKSHNYYECVSGSIEKT